MERGSGDGLDTADAPAAVIQAARRCAETNGLHRAVIKGPESDGAVQRARNINVVIMTPLSDDPMVELMELAA